MNNYISKDEAYDAVSDLVSNALSAQRDVINDKVVRRLSQIERILRNGSTIFEQSTGPRLAKMYELRQQLYCKITTLYDVLVYINES